MDKWQKAYTDWGFEDLDHRRTRLIVYAPAAAFWIHLITWLLSRHSIAGSVNDLESWLAFIVLATPGNVRLGFLLTLGPARKDKFTTTWLNPRVNPQNRPYHPHTQNAHQRRYSKRTSPAKTLAKIAIGLTVFAACTAFSITGGNLVEPSDTTTYPPRLRNSAEKEHMLQLINDARIRAGAPTLTMGTNDVAQIQADQLLQDCVFSHWSTDGLKPYMRYSLAGGYQTNGENIYTVNECDLLDTWLHWTQEPEKVIKEAVDGFLESPGHQETMLDPAYSKVNIGLAWDRNVFKVVQHFEGDHILLKERPVIEDGQLEFQGQLKHGLEFKGKLSLIASIFYDQPNSPLTKGHLSQTACYSQGQIVAAFLPPLRTIKDEFQFTETFEDTTCPDPYNVQSVHGQAISASDYFALYQQAKTNAETPGETELSVTVRKANRMTTNGDYFAVTADIKDILDHHGPGIYSVVLHAQLDTDDDADMQAIMEYSIFYRHEPPDTYRLAESP